MSKLTLRYRFDPSFFDAKRPKDDFGWLTVEVEADCSTHSGGFWVQWQDVKEFGEALGSFVAGQPIEAQWGFDMQEGEDLRLRIAVTPSIPAGDLSVQFEIADYEKPSDRARGHIHASQLDLDTFRAEIALLMDGKADEATLIGR